MPHKLKTQWKRIGRSGKTIDGRTIDPQWLRDAAETYNPELYKAQIWPDHLRGFNMGGVEAVRAEPNEEGGVDLFAEIAPNDIYLAINRAGQRLFTSMELLPNFRGTGKHYLAGLAATDSPASVATSEMRFSRIEQQETLLAEFVENTDPEFDTNNDDDDQPPRWFAKLFNKKPEGDMSKDQLEKLQQGLDALTTQFKAAFPDAKTPVAADDKGAADKDKQTQDFTQISDQLKAFGDRLDKLEGKGKGADADKATVPAEEFNALKTALEKLTEDFKAAVGEKPGTDGGEHVSNDEDLSTYV